MSDDTKALIDRLRDHENEGVTGSDRFHLRNEAADTVERLQRDRDAVAERCEKLWHALRRYAIVERYCHCCGQICQDGYEVEWHAHGCLAAPKDAP